MGLIVTFAGGRGSGKSTLSAELSRRLGYARVSFGDYVRGEARRRGLTSRSEVLQSIGEELVSAGATTFARNVLSTAVWDANGVLLVDGVRHKEILEAIRSIAAPSHVRLVFVNVDKEQRKERLSVRGDDGRQFDKLEAASTEVQVAGVLPKLADLVVDGSMPVTDSISTLVRAISQWLPSHTT